MTSAAARKAWKTRRKRRGFSKREVRKATEEGRVIFPRKSSPKKARKPPKFKEVHVPFNSDRKLGLQHKGYVTWGVDSKGYVLVKRDASIAQLRKGKARSKKLTGERRAFENALSPEEYDKLIAKMKKAD